MKKKINSLLICVISCLFVGCGKKIEGLPKNPVQYKVDENMVDEFAAIVYDGKVFVLYGTFEGAYDKQLGKCIGYTDRNLSNDYENDGQDTLIYELEGYSMEEWSVIIHSLDVTV